MSTTLSTEPRAPATPAAASRPADARPGLPPQMIVLAALLCAEVVVFSLLGTNFFTRENFLQVPRLNVELGLIALALTPVILTGGIDLSVGSLLGLCAVLFGKLWRDAGLPPWAAASATLAIGTLAGGLNAALITRLRIPPLIVTLGSFSLFRGLAEGITGGVDNFTNFPESFLALGHGTVLGVPAQVPVLVAAAAFFYLLVHRSTVGRALSAIGYAPEGARYAGIPVERRVALVYVLSGLCSALAAVIYVARVGQAKADAGTGYELSAITAVVLGGTSIFGGRGTVIGTILGLAAVALLENGLLLADRPAELSGIVKGLLLLVAIGIDWKPAQRGRAEAARSATTASGSSQEFEMRNSQLAALSAVILVAALIVAGGNYLLLRNVTAELAAGRAVSSGSSGGGSSASGSAKPSGANGGSSGKPITIAMMPKSKGNAYFIACRQGAEEAAKELGVNLIWDGPTDTDPAKQNEFVDTWVTRGVDVIAVAVENREGISTALRNAEQKGIKVVTWDSDAEPDARSFFVNQATPQGIGEALTDTAAKVMGGKGQFAIIQATLTAANQNEWARQIRLRQEQKYPDMKIAAVRPCDDQQPKAFEEARTIMNANPDVKLIMAICSPAVPGAAEAVKQSGRTDVKVIGLGLPNENKPYVHEGVTQAVILWNTMDLGYLTVQVSDAVAKGTLKPGETSVQAGRLGKMTIQGDNVLLGKPFVFTKENIDRFDF